MTDLLPCPFCGGEAEMIKPTDTERWAQVNCTACGCRGTEYPAEITKAVAAWNKRLASPDRQTSLSDDDWRRAIDCGFSQFESYARRDELKTAEQRRVAIDDAFQHAYGLLSLQRLRAMPLQDHGKPQLPKMRAETTPEMLDLARRLVLERPSTSYLQRRLAIGYNHACEIMEHFEAQGLVSAAGEDGKRVVLAEERADGGAACPRCRINRVGSRPVYLGSKAEGHICAVCWQQDRHAEEQTEAKP